MNKSNRASFCRACTGTVMVELAVILPLLLFLLFGITELGRALYQQNTLTQAVELGGRYMARVEGAVTDDCDVGGRWSDAVDAAKNLIECGTDTGCGTPILPNIIVEEPVVSSHTSGAVSGCVITVRATAIFQTIFGEDMIFIPSFDPNEPDLRLGGVTLNAATQERYIGY